MQRRELLTHLQQESEHGSTFFSPQIICQEHLQSTRFFDSNPLFVSNEADIEMFLPMIQGIDGGILATGFDQLFDLLTMSEGTLGVAVDIDNRVSLASRAVMEMAMYHRFVHQVYPTPLQLIEYFKDDNLPQVDKVMSYVLQKSDHGILMRCLLDGMCLSTYKSGETVFHTRYSLYDYLRLKSSDCFSHSWLSSPASLYHVLDLYSEGRCIIVHNDIRDTENLQRIGSIALQLDCVFNLLYLSNIESFLTGFHRTAATSLSQLFESLRLLPTSDHTLILRTSNCEVDDLVNPSQRIQNDPVLAWFFLSWHYNVQSYTDWKSKAEKDPRYLHGGWSSELKKNRTQHTGVSTIGLNH